MYEIWKFLRLVEDLKNLERNAEIQKQKPEMWKIHKNLVFRTKKHIQEYLRKLTPEDFTAALDLVKEEFPKNYMEITGYANYRFPVG